METEFGGPAPGVGESAAQPCQGFARPTFWAHVSEIVSLDRATVDRLVSDLGSPLEARLSVHLRNLADDLTVIASFLREQAYADELSPAQKQTLRMHASVLQQISDAFLEEREKLGSACRRAPVRPSTLKKQIKKVVL